MDELRPSARVLFLAPYAGERLRRLRFLMTAHSPCEFPEEGFDQVQPRPVFRCEDEFEPVGNGSQVCSCLLGNVSGMIVQDHANALSRWIVTVRQLQKLDELRTPVTIPYQSQYLAVEEIDTSQQRHRAVPFV